MSLKNKMLVFVCLLMSLKGLAQMPFYHYFEDTLKPGYRISGTFDSIDCNIAHYQSSLPTLFRPTLDLFNPEQLYTVEYKRQPFRFSAITHVGLSYAIGSNNSQQAGIAYTQSLSKDQFIQLNYQRIASNGALRNASMEMNHFEVAHLIRKQRYVSQFTLLFEGSKRSLNGGLRGDTLAPEFALIFQEIRKPDAGMDKRYVQLDWRHFISFTKDSLLKTGIYLVPHCKTETRRYEESGNLLSIYGNVNIDPSQTYDFWQRTEYGGAAGYFLHTPTLSVNAGFKTAYWEFHNLQKFGDTLELALVSDLLFTLSDKFTIKGNGYYNLAGAFGEKAINTDLKLKNPFADIQLNISYSDKYPLNYQRILYGNIVNYSWVNKQLISQTKGEISAQSHNKWIPVNVSAGFQNYRNLPFFLNNKWRQDTLTNLSFLHLSVRANFIFRKLFFQPAIRLQQSRFEYVPSLQLFGRLGFDGFLFKAKKLRAAIGVEGGYCSSFTLMDYVPMMDAYVLQVSGAFGFKMYTSMPKLHAFAQFELGFMRWFLRLENIEQTFLTNVNREAFGYPVVPLQFRIGLSWDLFN